MKNLIRYSLKSVHVGLLVFTLLLFNCGKKTELEVDTNPASVKTIISNMTGTVQIIRDSIKQDAVPGLALQAADVIETSANSSLELAMQGFGIIKIGPNAQVELSELIRSKQGDKASLSVKRGDVASLISRQNANSEFQVKTPTAIAGVRGTSFIVSVSSNHSSISVLDGSVYVRQPGQEEVILERNSQLVIDRQAKISKSMVRSLSPDSLSKLKKMTVFHKSNVLEFNTLVEELKKGSSELTILEGSTNMDDEVSRRDQKAARLDRDTVSRARRADVSKTLKRDTRKDPIKLEADKSYEQ